VEDSQLKIRVPQKSTKTKRSFGGHALSLGKLIIGPFRRKSKLSVDPFDVTGEVHDLEKPEEKKREPIERSPPHRSTSTKQVTHMETVSDKNSGEPNERSELDFDTSSYFPATRKHRRSRDRKRYRSDEPLKSGRFAPMESIQESKLPMETIGSPKSNREIRKHSDPGLLSPRPRKRHSTGEIEGCSLPQRPIRKRISLRHDDPLFRGSKDKNVNM